VRINLTDIDDRSFEALPAGKYIVKISGYEMKETSGNGKLGAGVPMINWEYTVQSDLKGDTKYQSRKLWQNTVIHEKTLFSLKALLRAAGVFSEEDLDGELDFEPDDLVGAELVVVVAQREYNGDMTNDVKRVRGLDENDEAGASLLP
jgi:hypothetical protein